MKRSARKMIVAGSILALLATPVQVENCFISSNQAVVCAATKTSSVNTTKSTNVQKKSTTKSTKAVVVKKKTYTKKFKFEDGSVYKTIKYEIPVLQGKTKAIKKINKFYENIAEKWKKSAEQNLDEARTLVKEIDNGGYYSDEVSFKVTYNKNGYISIFSMGYEYTMGAHGMQYYESHTFNVKTGKELTLTDIMSGSKASIKNKIETIFIKDIKKHPEEYFEEAIDTVKKTANANNTNFYLSKNGIVFYYGPYDLAAYARGIVEADIPYKTKDTFKLKLA